MNSAALHREGDKAVKIWFFLAVAWFAVFTFFGFIMAIKFFQPEFMSQSIQWTFGRVRPAHVNGVAFGFLSSGMLGAMFYISPRLTASSLAFPRLVSAAAFLWNGAVLSGILMIMNGNTQGREYAELPFGVDIAVIIVMIMMAVSIFTTIINRKEKKLYVSLWYYAGTLLWFPIVYFIGNVMWHPPVGALNGQIDAIFNWYYGHNVLGLWFTTLGIPAWYYLVPKLTKRPLYSHALSLIAFFSIVFFYTGVGAHHLLQSPIPEWVKTIAVIMSVLMLVPVVTFAVNILMTARGTSKTLFTNMPLRFIMAGFFMYILVSFQGSLQALRTTNAFLHFSQWTVGHAHLALLGGFGFLTVGMIYWFIPKLLNRHIFSKKMTSVSFWMLFIGFIIFFLAMTVAGLVANSQWWEHFDLVAALPTIRVHYILRAFGGGMVVLGAWIFAANILLTYFAGEKEDLRTDYMDMEPENMEGAGHQGHEKTTLPVLIMGSLALFFITTFLVIVIPYMFRNLTPSSVAHKLTASQNRGEQLYKNLGCFYCHSQFVRPQDWALGSVSQRGDHFYSVPHFLGTERTGPDLAKIGGKRPTKWHIIHHQNPRRVSPSSIMPPFDFLENKQLKDLAHYLQNMGGKDLEPKGFQPKFPPKYADYENPYMPLMMKIKKSYNKETKKYEASESIKNKWINVFEKGKKIYSEKCISCHGGSGNGQGPYARRSITRPANLYERISHYPHPDAPYHFWRIDAGVPGTTMPPWGNSLSEDDIWHVATYEMSFTEGTLRLVDGTTAMKSAMEFAKNNTFEKAPIEGTKEEFEKGKKLFTLYCQQCHGKDGLGNGPASKTSDRGYIDPQPANLREVGANMKMYGQYIYQIKEGLPTTQMPSWKKALTDEEIYLLSYYVQAFAPEKAWKEKWQPMYTDSFAKTLPVSGDSKDMQQGGQ